MRITLCLITWNEIQGCKNDIPQIKRGKFDDVFAIDGGSTDGTVEYLKKQKIKVYFQKKKGLNAAHKEAVKHCKTEAIIFFHPKGTIPIGDTLKFRKYFEKGYQLVIASRLIRGGKNEEDQMFLKPRKWFVLILATVTKVLWKREGNTIFDVLHGFRGITLSLFRTLQLKDSDLTVDIAGVIKSYKLKQKRIEFPTKELPRKSGVTHFKTLPTGYKIMKYLFREFF